MFFTRFRNQLTNLNYFGHEEDDQDDNSTEARLTLREQRLATRLYIAFLYGTLVILILFTLLSRQAHTTQTETPSLITFQKLQREKPPDSILTCSCSYITIPYKTFASVDVLFHEVCSSIFILDSWIASVYVENATQYGFLDFRKTANAQFALLEKLCSASRAIVFDVLTELGNVQLITAEVSLENEIYTQVNSTMDFMLTVDAPNQLGQVLRFLRKFIRGNSFVSGLNTNAGVHLSNEVHAMPFIQTVGPGWKDQTDGTAFCLYAECSISPVGFYELNLTDDALVMWRTSLDNGGALAQVLDYVWGFAASETALVALLNSTLDCLYQWTCVDMLKKYFPRLSQINQTILSSQSTNETVDQLVSRLFINNIELTLNYARFYNACAPRVCVLDYKRSFDLSYTITVVLGLYGALIIALRSLAPVTARRLLRMSHKQQRHQHIDEPAMPVSVRARLQRIPQILSQILLKVKDILIQLNLFKKSTSLDQQKQRIATHLYIILLLSILLLVLIVMLISYHAIIMTVKSPSYSTYTELYTTYPTTLSCSCSVLTVLFERFLSLSPSFHQVCSSVFMQDDPWLSFLLYVSYVNMVRVEDWRYASLQLFRLLSTLCDMSNSTVHNALQRFQSRTLASSRLLESSVLQAQFQVIIDDFIRSTANNFALLFNLSRVISRADQYLSYNANIRIILTNTTNSLNESHLSFQIPLPIPGVENSNLTTTCNCATNPRCQYEMAIYRNRQDDLASPDPTTEPLFFVDGFMSGCTTFESLLFTSLQCLYSNSTCLSTLVDVWFAEILSDYPVSPIIPLNATTTSRFPPSDRILSIISNLMVEDWSPSLSFVDYFHACAPSECTYSKDERKSLIAIGTTLLSIFGGLSILLRFLSPIIIRLFNRHRQPVVRDTVNTSPMSADRLYQSVKSMALKLNIFPPWTFGSHLDRETIEYLGQLTTRLYVVSLISILSILTLYTFIRPRRVTKMVDEPTQNSYANLLVRYADTLKCPCTTISIRYSTFASMQPFFHAICSSVFVTNEWQSNLTANLNFSTIPSIDYRQFISAHFDLLASLCQLSVILINDALLTFLSSSFISQNLLAESTFIGLTQQSIDQTRQRFSIDLIRVLQFQRVFMKGNGITTTYGTNWNYKVPESFSLEEAHELFPAENVATVYPDGCACGLNASACTIQAAFLNRSDQSMIVVRGFKRGCLPSESLFASTLECLYDSACIRLIVEQMDMNTVFPGPLSPSDRYSINTSVNFLAEQLFVEGWSTSLNYSQYFNQCAIASCSYTYIEQSNLLDTVSIVMGLYGGLTVILKWWCPLLVKIGRYLRSGVLPTNTVAPNNVN